MTDIPSLAVTVRVRWWVKPLIAALPTLVRPLPCSNGRKLALAYRVIGFAINRGVVVDHRLDAA